MRRLAAGEHAEARYAVDMRTDRAAACVVNRLTCEDCGTSYYSAAAKTLVEQGERCAKCGGVLAIDESRGKVAANGIRPADGGDEPPTE